MLILSALLRAVYAIVRLGVRVAGSVEIGRSYRNPARPGRKSSPPEWESLPFQWDEVDWYQPLCQHSSCSNVDCGNVPKRFRPRAAMPKDQPIDGSTGLPAGSPVVRPQEPE